MKCSTCGICFEDRDEVKRHYKSNLHVVNSKLRQQGKPSITQADLELLQSHIPPQEESGREKRKRERREKAREEMQQLYEEEEQREKEREATKGNEEDESKAENFAIPSFENFPSFKGPHVNIFDQNREYEDVEACLESMEKELGLFSLVCLPFIHLALCFYFSVCFSYYQQSRLLFTGTRLYCE